jgi:hypothetical protein
VGGVGAHWDAVLCIGQLSVNCAVLMASVILHGGGALNQGCWESEAATVARIANCSEWLRGLAEELPGETCTLASKVANKICVRRFFECRHYLV